MFLHDEKPEEVENITSRMSEMAVTQVPYDEKDGRSRSISNRSLSHDSVEAKHWAQTVRGDGRAGSFGGASTGSASSPIFIPKSGTTTNVPPRMYSFDLYESAGVPTPDSESGDQTTMKGTWCENLFVNTIQNQSSQNRYMANSQVQHTHKWVYFREDRGRSGDGTSTRD